MTALRAARNQTRLFYDRISRGYDLIVNSSEHAIGVRSVLQTARFQTETATECDLDAPVAVVIGSKVSIDSQEGPIT